jgi:hypothetical protein
MLGVALAAGIGLWLAGNRVRVGWTLAALAHGLWLADALVARQYALATPVVVCGLVCVRNARAGRRRPRRQRGVAHARGGHRWPS